MNLHVLTPSTANRERSPGSLLRRFWRWWSGEILEVVPRQVRDIFDHQQRVLVVSAEADDLRARLLPALAEAGAETADPGELWAEADIAVVELSPLQAVRRRVSLPLATEDRLADVLGYEMNRFTPYAQEDVYFDYRVADRDTARQVVNVDIVVTLRNTVDAILGRLLEYGILPSKVTLQGVVGTVDHDLAMINLMPERSRRRTISKREIVPAALTATAVLLALVAVGYPLAQQWLRLQELDAEIAGLRTAAISAQDTMEEIAAAARQGGFFAEKWASTPTKIQLLDEISRVVPDDTWLSQVQVKQDTVRIQGESEGASSLIGLLETSELLRDVRFSSPVTKNPRTSQDRFVIQAVIETPAGEGGAK